MSAEQLAKQRSASSVESRSRSKDPVRPNTPIDTRTDDCDLEPCAATASYFIYTQGSAVVLLRHDSLKVERRFEKHREKVLLIAVDNVSECNAGSLCVTYDADLTAIVWDLHHGHEKARFISYEPIRVAAWMKNGNIAFGNNQGSVVIFEPSTSEHISARTIFDPVTAIAPAADCQTFAIGYKNGSILIASLNPQFSILHTLTTQRAPSPIVGLAWHASSSKQKSDMLASQTSDGDLRVWSVSKPALAENPKTIRILKRGDNVEPGVNWMGWSKNGRVVQYQDGEVWLWDVRTKHVASELVPIVGSIRAITGFGANATLFTVGADNTVRQFDLSPPTLSKERMILPMAPPAAPSTSIRAQGHHIPGTAPPMPVRPTSRQHSSRERGASRSSLRSTPHSLASLEQAQFDRASMASPVSTASSIGENRSTQSSLLMAYPRQPMSISSRAASGTTFSTISPSMVGNDSIFSGGTSIYQSTASIGSSGRRSRGSRLRNEVLHSPESQYVDLFPRTRVRLANLQAEAPAPLDQDNMTPNELRKRMLHIVFGWDDDIEPLVRDELHHHQPGSTSAVLLSKWLGEVDSDMMATAIASGNISSSDWMVLALSQMGGATSMGKMGQAFVQRLLQQGDFHTSATILLGLGDREDAVEVYVSRCFFMEAILLTCLIFPEDWQRQAHLVRRWGDFVVENSQQQLAIRCFTCTGVEPPLPWGSPSPRLQDSASQAPSSISSMISPTLSPPTSVTKPNRMTAKNSSLKVITSFDTTKAQQYRFPGLASTDRTPTKGAGITPIAESAISQSMTPGGFINGQSMYSPTTLRANTPSAFRRPRLPSIGEGAMDIIMPQQSRPSQLPTPDNSGSDDVEREVLRRSTKSQPSYSKSHDQEEEPAPLLLSSARYDPGSATTAKETPITAVPQTVMRNTRKGQFSLKDVLASQDGRLDFRSEDKKLSSSEDQATGNDLQYHNRTIHSVSISRSKTEPELQREARSQREGPCDTLLSAGLTSAGLTSATSEAFSMSAGYSRSAKSPSISGRSVDQFISSLDEAGRHKNKSRSDRRVGSREGRSHTHKSRSKSRAGEQSLERERNGKRYVRPAKRSPSSPIPMTPDLYDYITTPGLQTDTSGAASPALESRDGRGHKQDAGIPHKYRSGSKTSELSERTIRHRSPESPHTRQWGAERGLSQGRSSRHASPGGRSARSDHGRMQNKSRTVSRTRSPSSPQPFSPVTREQTGSSADDEEVLRPRHKSTNRSRSRRPQHRGSSTRRDPSSDVHQQQQDIRAGRTPESEYPRTALQPPEFIDHHSRQPDQPQQSSRSRANSMAKKTLAQRELEARRESLLRNPEAPAIPYPDEVSRPGPLRTQTEIGSHSGLLPRSAGPEKTPPLASYVPAEQGGRLGAASVGPYGLPATPRAMRHPRYDAAEADSVPAVPEASKELYALPEAFYQGGPMRDIARSMSAPLEQQRSHSQSAFGQPTLHPVLYNNPQSAAPPNLLQPLGNIGSRRSRGSIDAAGAGTGNTILGAQVTAGIDETLHAAQNVDIIRVEDIDEDDGPIRLPQLQHLGPGSKRSSKEHTLPPPPPPPPQPHQSGASPNTDNDISSLSSNSNVGAINIVLDDEPGDESKVIERPPPPTPPSRVRPPSPLSSSSTVNPTTFPVHTQYHTGLQTSVYPENTDQIHSYLPARSPPPSATASERSDTRSHRRGRSDQFSKGIKGFTDRLRSNSRSRAQQSGVGQNQQGQGAAAPVMSSIGSVQSANPYESVPPLYF